MPERVDLRSDTVTRPTPGMRAAMAAAEVGDDVYGEDPTARRLEERVAELLGQQAALFTPTGSMANLLGVRALVPVGTELLCEESAHVVRAELGAHAALGAVTTRTWHGTRGGLDLAALSRLLAPDAGPYLVSTAAVAVENTHNFGGGAVVPLASLAELRALLAGTGVRVHLDGARLWNAAVASQTPAGAFGRLVDTVSVCLSKGLGAPVGSLLAAPADVVAQARVWRKRLGGGMRQVGVLAAAGLWALDHHVERLADDHAAARALAEVVADGAPPVVDPAAVGTNIVVLSLAGTGWAAPALVAAAAREGVLVGALGARTVRAVTHLDAPAADCRRAAEVLARLLSGPPPG